MVSPVRVLLVEDSDVYRESLVFLLERDARLDVVGAVADGASAVRACAEREPDVVVIDYRLPDMNGFEVATAIRSVRHTTAIVFLSASAGQAEYDAAQRSGAALVRKDDGVGAVADAIANAAERTNT
ncbi:MAG: response regulator transcription factor [Gaiellaceae bacterium]